MVMVMPPLRVVLPPQILPIHQQLLLKVIPAEVMQQPLPKVILAVNNLPLDPLTTQLLQNLHPPTITLLHQNLLHLMITKKRMLPKMRRRHVNERLILSCLILSQNETSVLAKLAIRLFNSLEQRLVIAGMLAKLLRNDLDHVLLFSKMVIGNIMILGS